VVERENTCTLFGGGEDDPAVETHAPRELDQEVAPLLEIVIGPAQVARAVTRVCRQRVVFDQAPDGDAVSAKASSDSKPYVAATEDEGARIPCGEPATLHQVRLDRWRREIASA
jgi:hypothetical protein